MAIQWDEWVILPSQMIPVAMQTPEQRLVAAVLENAIDCLGKYRDTKVDYYRAKNGSNPQRWTAITPREEAIQWIISNDKSWPFSFVNVCDVLGLEPEEVRARLLRRKAS